MAQDFDASHPDYTFIGNPNHPDLKNRTKVSYFEDNYSVCE